MTAEELYKKYLALRDQYNALVRADPEMLAATPEAEQLRKQLGLAWVEYYFTKYPEQIRWSVQEPTQ